MITGGHGFELCRSPTLRRGRHASKIVAKYLAPYIEERARVMASTNMIAAIFNLNHPAHTVHWHFFTMTVSNVVVIVLMLVVFTLAVLAPFPGTARKGRAK